MALQTSRISSLLLVMSVATVLSILSWEHLSKSISRMSFSRHRGEDGSLDSDIKVWDKKGNSSLSPAVFITTHKAKLADSTKTNPVAKLKTDQMRASTHGAVAETPMPILSKKSFKKLPQWDFDDVYNQDAPPRQTTCAQSLRNSEDESFKKAFLPNIRLFLHKDNINMSEWNRLSHFNNPFGFMEFKYDVPEPRSLVPLWQQYTSADKVESNENNSLKYVPGKARSHHLQMMMSTEELEEEQRVQREQLAAIFQLLKENKETFGEVSEGDMEEQLRLYSI